MKRKIKFLQYKRKRIGKTNYKKRLGILKSKKYRLVIRKSLNNVNLQIIVYEKTGDKILVSAHSSEIKKLGWKYHTGNIPSSYLTGYLLGMKAKKKEIGEAILDIGLYNSTKGSRIYASLKGVIDSGFKIAFSDKILPDDKRIKGEHIKDYFSKFKKDKDNNQFCNYIKSGINPDEIFKNLDEIKNKING